ncbi:hypothetical protein B0T10DRAFT_475809 [Thelonectria olida]|uniref:Uncharacterized protein n=1 Tax=Thelonectria olida TaxID=1576542 RepID=A0A9P8WEZ1_9HYPO|nr:hypothetical protein B0T10DRAFT_475809 [Thelonectria olida]
MTRNSSSPTLETPDTFMTADRSDAEESTAATTPIPENPAPYLNSRQLPRDLKVHTQIYFEEQLYPCATHLLHSITASGTRRQPLQNPDKPISVPPTTQLALLNTLLVHPQHTTRAERQENLDVPSQAHDYLRTVLQKVGPVNADFRTAFQFHPGPRFVRRFGQSAQANESDSDEEMSLDDERIRGRISNEGSLWSRGQDFWSTVGWAFNCSIQQPRRWRYWRVWLEFMIDVLEADWEERERLDNEAYQSNGENGKMPSKWREESMMLMYMDQQDGRTRGISGIIKALFADGGDLYSTTFREVFEKEHKGPRKEGGKKRKRNDFLDLENDKFGDYFDDDSISSGISEPPTPQKPRDKRKSDSRGYESGMAETITLRLRLFKLLSAVTYGLRNMSELDDLYRRYTSAIKLLPLETFALFVGRMGKQETPLIQATRITVTKELFHILVPSSFKDPYKVDPEGDLAADLSAPMLEHCYILHPANTVAMEDNAKLSLVVEAAMQLLMRSGRIEYSRSFAAAGEKGIKAREAKVKKKRTGKMRDDPTDELAHEVLARSGQRIRVLLELLSIDRTDGE